MASTSAAYAGFGFLYLLVFCISSCSNCEVVSAFVPHNEVMRSQRRKLMQPLSKTAITMVENGSFFAGNENDDDSLDTSIPRIDKKHEVTKSRLIWLTGFEDLRICDHGGFTEAFSKAVANDDDNENELIIPVFVIDPKIHLRSQSTSSLKRLHESLTALEESISSLPPSSMMSSLVVRIGSPSRELPALAHETNAVACHVVEDDVVTSMRTAQQSGCASLTEMGVEVYRWTNRLRPSAPWASDGLETSSNQSLLPSFFPDYCKIADTLPVSPPQDDTIIDQFRTKASGMAGNLTIIRSEGLPSLKELLDMAESATPDAVLEARSSTKPFCDTTEPFDAVITEKWSTEKGAMKALNEFCRIGNVEFTNKYFIASDAANKGLSKGKSMYASSVARIIRSSPAKNLALREGPTRAFSNALNLGAVSPRNVIDAARNRSPVTPPVFFWDKRTKIKDSIYDGSSNHAGLFPSDNPFWGRRSEGSLSDVVEWREWFHLLAKRSLSLQEMGEPATSGGEKESMKNDNNKNISGDPRESGTVNYWRWKGQHLVRYLTFPAGKDYGEQDEETRDPAILLVHGFAASCEQWERLVYNIRQQKVQANNGKDTTPPIYAIDLLGFGHSEKPGLSYTQYMWESQLVDFAIEVMESIPMVMVGNSIGGGLSAGAAASLGKKICRGLILLNTAGILLEPDTYRGYDSSESNSDIGGDFSSYTEAAIEGNPETIYSPVPFFGNKALDVFGAAIIGLIYPEIEKRLSLIYGNRIENADPAVVYAIQQGASSPGSANVIGCGQKLAPNRPLNEVLMGVDDEDRNGSFPTLVVMGLDDRVSSPAVAKLRAELFSRLNPDTITLKKISDAGHCPHDETPDKVANHMLNWLSSSSLSASTKIDTKNDAVAVKEN